MKNYLILFTSIFAVVFSSCNLKQAFTVDTSLPAKEYSDKINELPGSPVIDVRTPDEYSKGHLSNAVNINWNSDDFVNQISAFDKSKPVFVYCLSGNRSASAAGKMRSAGFTEVYELKGGIMKWIGAKLPVITANSQLHNSASGMTRQQFDEKINNSKLVLVDFYADWCAPCREIKPYLDEISEDMTDKVEIVRVNVDENQELCRELKIDGIPDLRLYKNKTIVWSNTGYIEKKDIVKNIKVN